MNLSGYTDTFVQNGITTQEKLSLLTNDHLKMLNIPYAHRKKILKYLRETSFTTNPSHSHNTTLNYFTNNDKYEELVCPAEEDDIALTAEEQRRTFYQAVVEFKQKHSTPQVGSERYVKESQTNTKVDVVKKEEIAIGNDDDDNERQIEVVENERGEYTEMKAFGKGNEWIDPMTQWNCAHREMFPLHKSKTLCHQCLHMLLQDKCILKHNKPFCSLRCVEVFERKNIIQCKKCNNNIEIAKSFPSMVFKGVYYCSEMCLKKEDTNSGAHNNTGNKGLLNKQTELEYKKELEQTNKSTVINKNNSNNTNKSFSSDSDQPIDILDS